MKPLMIAMFMAMLTFHFSSVSFSQQNQHDYAEGQIWVKVKQETVLGRQAARIGKTTIDDRHDLSAEQVPFLKELNNAVEFDRVEQPFRHIQSDQGLNRIYRLTLADAAGTEEVIRKLNSYPSVEYAEPVELLKKTLTPNDPDFNSTDQWCLFQINAETAWNLGTGSSSIVVAIVDDAVEITHDDLSPVIWTNPGEIAGNGVDDDGNGYVDDVDGFDVANNDNDPNPDGPAYDHGTHVAGIAGAATNNATGVASIGFGVSLMAVKSTNSASVVSHGYDGVVYAVNSGADVINMSWGGSGSSTTAQSIIDFAYANGVTCIAAAGNDDVSTQFYPAAYNHVISVASSTFGDSKSGFSNYGSWIDITAPGSAIWSTVPGNTYDFKQGTSMASPMVAGLAGLILSLNSGLNPDDVENCIRSTADNIDGSNPSYVGQLGDGRINALAAMNCVSATLNWSPVADFNGAPTNIVVGQSVNFTDLSYHNPTSWDWTFTGGTPSTHTGPTPPAITYSTAGSYTVELTVTNANGSDTKTETAYITVNALTGCDTVSNTIPSDANYTWTWGAVNGYIGGHNFIHPQYICDKYSGLGSTNLMGADFYFTQGETSDPTAYITIMVWEDAGGSPGTVVYTEDVLIDEIEANVAGPGPGSFYITQVNFDAPVFVSTSDFYVGYELFYAAGDTVNCALTDDLTSDLSRNNTMMYYINPADDPLGLGGGWYQTGGEIGTAEWSMHIYPRITQTPPTAVIAPVVSACEGTYVDFDGSSSPNAFNWEWAINGTSTPYPTGSNPSVLMSSAGTHMVYLAAYNSCGFYHIDSAAVIVSPTPDVSVTSSNDTICPGGASNLSASGATSFTWSPASGLSCTSCPAPVATPSITTTYSVTGTTAPCSATTYVTIEVDDSAPTADFISSGDTICPGEVINYNGAISVGASLYEWTFVGGDISSSSSANPTVVYNTDGTYSTQLLVENSCGQIDTKSTSVVVKTPMECATGAEGPSASLSGMDAYVNRSSGSIVLSFPDDVEGVVEIELYNAIGKLVRCSSVANPTSMVQIPVLGLSKELYLLSVRTDKDQYATKLVVQ